MVLKMLITSLGYLLHLKMSTRCLCPYLGSLRLNPSHTSRAIDDRVLRYDLTCVDLTEGSNDTATGEDHIPANISWKTTQIVFDTVSICLDLNHTEPNKDANISPLDSITLLSPIFRACDTISCLLRQNCGRSS